ncbi:MAG: outer membrane beta-barrel protein [Kiritimatiellaeota bacterium]|nr:outer membrane beta-barrel protein [Kiritimatiellota bacterium]
MKKAMVIFAAVLGLATSSQAVKLGTDTQSLDLSGGLNFESSAGVNSQIHAGYGYFIMDYFEIGGLVNIQHNDAITTFGFGPKAEYNFELDLPVVVPFVGVALTFQHAKVTNTSFFFNSDTSQIESQDDSDVKNALNLDVYGGAKFFITDQFAVSADLVISAATSDLYERRDGGTSKTNAHIELGLRYYF